MNADAVFAALKERHPLPEWVLVRELRIGTGYSSWRERYDYEARKRKRGKWEQRMDAWALNCYPSKGFVKIAYEIKVRHHDFVKEKQDPRKREAAKEVSDYFYFAAPRGLIAPMEVPKDCGLLAVYGDGSSEVLKAAPKLPASRLDWRFVASLARNALQMERG